MGESQSHRVPKSPGLRLACACMRLSPARRAHHAAAQAGVAILAGPPPGLHATTAVTAALAPGTPRGPEDGHRAGCVFITEPARGREAGVTWTRGVWGEQRGAATFPRGDWSLWWAQRSQGRCVHRMPALLTAPHGSCPRRCGPHGEGQGCCSFAGGPGSRCHRTYCTVPRMPMASTLHSWWEARGQSRVGA